MHLGWGNRMENGTTQQPRGWGVGERWGCDGDADGDGVDSWFLLHELQQLISGGRIHFSILPLQQLTLS